MKRVGLLSLGLALAASASPPAERCWPVTGDHILARDLAKAVAVFSKLDPELPIAYTPLPGVRRIFSAGQLKHLAHRHELPEANLRDVCFERATEPLTEQRVLSALRGSLGMPEAHLELLEFSRHPTPAGELRFPLSGLTAPNRNAPNSAVLWRGSLRYGERRSMPVWAKVRISLRRSRVVAKEQLKAGRPVEARQLRLEQIEEFPFPDAPVASIEKVVGKLPRRTVRAGEAVRASLLRSPSDVERGDTVTVEVFSGGAALRFDARAETAGNVGEQITVQNPSSGRRFQAFVEGQGRVVVRTGSREDES